jgi:hypothetical protein
MQEESANCVALSLLSFVPQAMHALVDRFIGKGHPIRGHVGPSGIALLILNLGGGGWSAPRLGRFTSGKDPVPIVQEAGLVPGPVWKCAKNIAPTGIFYRSPDRPAHSQSLLGPQIGLENHVYSVGGQAMHRNVHQYHV